MTEHCQKCGIRTTPEEPLCQCVDVLHAEIDRLRAAFKQACEVAESAQWCLMQDVSGSIEPLKTMRANREGLLRGMTARELRAKHGWPEPSDEQKADNLYNNTGIEPKESDGG